MMNAGNAQADRLVREFDEFYAKDDFNYYPLNVSTNVIRALMKKAGIAPGARVLDLGCGTGYYSMILDQLGYDVVGLDFSPMAIEKAAQRNTRCRFVVGDARDLRYPPESFHCIVLAGCSLMKTRDVVAIREMFEKTLAYISPGGALVTIWYSDLTGTFTESGKSNFTWTMLNEMLPHGGGLHSSLYLSHFRIVSVLGTLGLNPLLTRGMRMPGLKLYRHLFHIIEKIT